jgi:hypothetical protein
MKYLINTASDLSDISTMGVEGFNVIIKRRPKGQIADSGGEKIVEYGYFEQIKKTGFLPFPLTGITHRGGPGE